MARNTFVCADCRRLEFDTSSSMGKSREQVEAELVTNFGRFKTFTEYAWHLANIHGKRLKRTEADMRGRDVTDTSAADACFTGLWG